MSPAPRRAGTRGARSSSRLEDSYRVCEEIAHTHYENFPIATRLLPKASRLSLAAIYAFARQADDFADEDYGPSGPTRAERLEAIDAWEGRLIEACAAAGADCDTAGSESGGASLPHDKTQAIQDGGGEARSKLGALEPQGTMRLAANRPRRGFDDDVSRSAPSHRQQKAHETRDPALPLSRRREEVHSAVAASQELKENRSDSGLVPAHADAVFTALTDTLERHDLEGAPFFDLLSAFRQDVVVSEYRTRADLLDYCRRSANPVGRIVLAIHGDRKDDTVRWSDALCTALQLTNFWQDVGIDARKGRVYLPEEDRLRFRVSIADLAAGSASAQLRGLVLEEIEWAFSLFDEARPLLGAGPAALRRHIRIVWNGGVRILEKINEASGDVLAARPKLTRSDWVRILARSIFQPGARRTGAVALDPAGR